MIGLDFIIFGKFKQDIIYYLLPKKQDDCLLINTPVVILEPFLNWINDKSKINAHFLFGASHKYTYIGSYVHKHKIYTNRYNVESRELLIKFGIIVRGHVTSISK